MWFTVVLSAFLPVALCLTDAEKAKFLLGTNFKWVESGTEVTLTSNNVPDHPVGTFPDEGNRYGITEQTFSITIPKSPSMASEASCVPLGAIGMTTEGVGIYNVYTAILTNAVTDESFDNCNGHPDDRGFYHYHQLPNCVYKETNNELLGVAVDGYPFYGPKDENGKELTSADLDECHGRTYNGQYQYHITRDFPYTLGCFKGVVEFDRRQLKDCHFAGASNAFVSGTLLLAAMVISMFV